MLAYHKSAKDDFFPHLDKYAIFPSLDSTFDIPMSDATLLQVPKLKVCALRFTEGARSRIVKAGGSCMTFEQLAVEAPLGQNTVLLQVSQSIAPL